ncbi:MULTISPECIES: HPF/RaiA family ribosome-associated protein [Spiribacter]|jgi:ribosomal subunit interface protein|uniref:HPF/RaiA family ribosome-associated protein n=2 Tax=Spiribacter TaxID=1335745 RepID=A0A557RKC1_9GAMM|nr:MULTISPECIES: HPF/RaiA family ribosome-associated protein [Spiribacter]PZA01184.1 HPF/RaiA family ribosome-associated protein [Gammaproteobacteria bacterium 2W06]AUB77909.1 hypothetical protein BBH56_01440 [Spiribacter roseus]KAF0279868.1 hypothetical protein BA897_03760 [Spiribacter roseus]KAF0281941.1 hypothetical protein BA900_02170 [Spiribacter roseus]KAF0283527.1 hypothetical protein BA898_03090 [Spiribacter roseus]
MELIINPGDGVHLSDALRDHVQHKLEPVERKHGERLTRIEVHFKDDNAGKGGADDVHCLLEAHPRGRDPLVAEAVAEDAYTAAHQAAGKLDRSLAHHFGKDDRVRRH